MPLFKPSIPDKKTMIAYLLSIVFVSLIASLIVWLWYRQPGLKPVQQKVLSTNQATSEASPKANDLEIKNPQNLSILTDTLTTLSGKTLPNSHLVIYSQNTHLVTKTQNDGTFKEEIRLSKGLNLMNLRILSERPDQNLGTILTFWVATEQSANDKVFAGSIKSIFDPLITITTPTGQSNIRTSNSTEIAMPPGEVETSEIEEATRSALADLRVGDYAIALGKTSDEDSLLASSLQIIRENKPQITKSFTKAQILTGINQNAPSGLGIFSVKDTTSGDLYEFTLDQNTEIIQEVLVENEKETKDEKRIDATKLVTKDKTAIIIYHLEDNQKTPDLVYLLQQ